MKLTTKGEYSLLALSTLVAHRKKHGLEKPIQLEKISRKQDISLHYLEQLFRKLRIGGIVKAIRGPGGGYVLARPQKEISIYEVLSVVGEQIEVESHTGLFNDINQHNVYELKKMNLDCL